MAKFILSAFGDEIAPGINEQLDTMISLGINHLEIRQVNKKVIADQSREDVVGIKKVLDEKNCSISAIGSAVGKCSIKLDMDEHMKEVNRVMDYAEILETDKIRMFSFVIPEGDDPYKYTDEVLRRLEKILELAVKRNFILYNEDEKPVYCNNAVRCEIVMRELFCDNFRMAFDPANFVQFGQATYPDAWKLLRKYVSHMHIKDALFADKSVQVVGEGEGRVKDILTELYHSDYEGYLVLEPHISAFNGHVITSGKVYDGPAGFKLAVDALRNMLSEIEAQ